MAGSLVVVVAGVIAKYLLVGGGGEIEGGMAVNNADRITLPLYDSIGFGVGAN